MKLLLDTHIWLDFAAKPNAFRGRMRRELTSPRSELWLSPISVWEALKLAEKGKLKSRNAPVESVDRVLKSLALREAPITFQIARETAMFT